MTVRYSTTARAWQVEATDEGALVVRHNGNEVGRTRSGPLAEAPLDPAALAALSRLGVPIGELRREPERAPGTAEPGAYIA